MPSALQKLPRIKDMEGEPKAMTQRKKCSSCQVEKEFSAFSKQRSTGTALQSHCRECCVARKKRISDKHRAIVGRWKLRKGCALCGFKAEHYCQLDLDHIDPATKHKTLLHHAYEPAWKLERIKTELAKCLVVCKNCHAKKTITRKEHMKGNEWQNPGVMPSLTQAF